MLPYGLVGVGIAVSVTHLVLGITSLILVRPIVGVSYREIGACLAPSTLAAVVALGALMPLKYVLFRLRAHVTSDGPGLDHRTVPGVFGGLSGAHQTVVAYSVPRDPALRRSGGGLGQGAPRSESEGGRLVKVLMIAAYPLEPGIVNGGIESVTSTLVPALAAHEDVESVTVLRFHHGEATTEYRREGPKVEVYYVRGQDRWRTLTGSALDVRKARRLVAQIEPDVVHGQEIGWIGDIATRCSRRSVVTVHGLPHVEIRLSARQSLRDRLRIRPIELMVGRVLRRARVVISISSYDEVAAPGSDSWHQGEHPNPTGVKFFSLFPSGPTAPRLLFAGVMTPRKNVVGVLNAFAQVQRVVPNARLVMVGPQPDPGYARPSANGSTRWG